MAWEIYIDSIDSIDELIIINVNPGLINPGLLIRGVLLQ